jgi:hypothetical protein
MCTKMFISTIRNPKTIPPKIRIAADTLRVVSKSNAIRNACLEVTRRLIAKMGEGSRHTATITSLMLFSRIVLARVVYIGLFLYKQDIFLL